ncbi:Nbs-lrr resistance protein [Dorcoceras hygrometricum]|uniref:Nbs-lrr resistance protein n=1 Tax=Dorcoceras hygrometricum TaxID=472368 RepID=A0A2Z7A710_9LAMI|nr:Nbs-lrr resistance protein [Dorcoceras hygrometricum]
MRTRYASYTITTLDYQIKGDNGSEGQSLAREAPDISYDIEEVFDKRDLHNHETVLDKRLIGTNHSDTLPFSVQGTTGLAMETSKVKSGVRNQAEAKLNQLEHSRNAKSADDLCDITSSRKLSAVVKRSEREKRRRTGRSISIESQYNQSGEFEVGDSKTMSFE